MKLKYLILLFVLTGNILVIKAQLPNYKNAKLPVNERVEDLLKRMSLEEKVAQLQTSIALTDSTNVPINGLGCLTEVFNSLSPKVAAQKYNDLQKAFLQNTRLGIPVLYHGEAVFGLMANGTTCFPQPLGQAATFNLQLHNKIAKAIAKETHSWGHRQVLSPTINVCYDPRWGRTHETYGEDPLLVSLMGASYIQAMEQAGVITTPKHFAANIGHNGMFGGAIMYNERFLREVEFPPFKKAVEVGCGSIMPAYNTINGVPCTSNKWLLIDVLRDEWGFKGFVGSDYGAVAQIWDLHKQAETKVDAAVIALSNGLDVEMPEVFIFGDALIEAVNAGKLDISIVDKAVSRVLAAKFQKGLFENPYANPDEAEKICNSDEHRALALEAAKQSIVLLKNNNNVLPFSKKIKSIAVLGPLANEQLLGNYAPFGIKKVNILEGIKNKVGNTTQVFYNKGAELGQLSLPIISSQYLFTTENNKDVNGLKVEYFNNVDLSGTPAVTRIDPNVDFEWGEGVPHPFINKDNFSIRCTGKLVSPVSGTYRIGLTVDDGARLFIDDKLIIDEWKGGSVRLVETDFTFEKDKSYKLRLEYFDGLFSAVCRMGWSAVPANDIDKAVELAKNTEACVIVVGAIDGEGKDRADLDLTQNQEDLIHAVAKTGKPFVVILATGNVITAFDWAENTPAILETWYSGEEGGNAVANVLFGDYNPGGKLPITFPKTTGQVPCYYFMRPGTGTSYLTYGNEPMFEFGFGLSYTSFEYSDIKLSSTSIKANQSIEITFNIKNTGKVEGDEVPQLYLIDEVGSVTPIPKILRNFDRITLNPAETKTIRFTLQPSDLCILNQDMKWVVEPGKFIVQIGSSSKDIRLEQNFKIEK